MRRLRAWFDSLGPLGKATIIAPVLGALVAGVFAILAASIQASGREADATLKPAPSPSSDQASPTDSPEPSDVDTTSPAGEWGEASPSDTASPAPQPGSIAYLDTLDPVGDNRLRSEPKQVSHTTYAHALFDPRSHCSNARPVEYVVPKGTQKFTSIVGLADDSRVPEAKIKFTFYVDGRIPEGGQITVGLKETRSIEFALDGALRLRLEAILVGGADKSSCRAEAVAVWGDPTLTW
ncbi:MAG: hypothetical protein ACRDT6_05910 [Micromonosporaceae bacterium]